MNNIEFDFLEKGLLQEAKKHPAFEGVLLSQVKHGIMQGLRLLYVDVAPHKGMLSHVHEDETELHFVISGSGKASVENVSTEYTKGVINKIPAGAKHDVTAGSDGLQMIAVFIKD